MAAGWADIALRFAVYVDLMVLFGVPLFATHALGPPHETCRIRRRYGVLAAVAAVIGIVLSFVGLGVMAMQMAGASDFSGVTRHVVEMILTRTGAGFSWLARILALAVCLGAAAGMHRASAARFRLLSGAGAIALASLAWTGHGAMDDGGRGYLHLAADVLHLLAAGAWVGALLAFFVLTMAARDPAGRSLAILSRAASGFAEVGTAIVATLIVTGAINYVLILGPSLRPLVATVYGRLLAAKLVLFGGMLTLAAANRYALAPRLRRALGGGQHGPAAAMLRRSLRVEAGLALLVLALVAWLGMLAPDA